MAGGASSRRQDFFDGSRLAGLPSLLLRLFPPVLHPFLDQLFCALLGGIVKDFVHAEIILSDEMAWVIVGQFVVKFLSGTPDSWGVPVFKVLGHGNCPSGFDFFFRRLNC